MKVVNADVVILGGGIAGLVAHHYFPEAVMITSSVGGQTVGPLFQLGPRFIHVGPNTDSLLKDLGFSGVGRKRVFIGYYYNKMLHKEVSRDMRKSYLVKTRGKGADLTKDIMSSGSNCFHSYDLPPESMACRIIDRWKDTSNLIQGVITGIYEDYIRVAVPGEKGAEDFKVNYNKMISTIPRPVYNMLLFGPSKDILVISGQEKLESISTTFYLIKVDAQCRRTFFNFGKKTFDYTYFPEEGVPFHRISRMNDWSDGHLEGRMVLESIEENLGMWNKICFDKLLMRIEDKFTLKGAQIINSIPEREEIEKDDKVFPVGRYAEWCHKVKLEEVVERVKQIKEILG